MENDLYNRRYTWKIDFGKLLFTKLMDLTEKIYVIICGDCGVLFFHDKMDEMIEMYSA